MPLAVLPAAGRSARMGRPKLLLPYGETTVVGSLVDALEAGGVAGIALVTAPADARLARWGHRRGLTVTTNPHPEGGMLSSIRRGMGALAGDAGLARPAAALARRGEVVLVTPADLPALAAATVRAVLAARREADAPLAVPVIQGHRGHPVAIAPRLLEEVDRLALDGGLRQLVVTHAAELLEVPVDDRGAVDDVDTPEDYRRLAGEAAAGGSQPVNEKA